MKTIILVFAMEEEYQAFLGQLSTPKQHDGVSDYTMIHSELKVRMLVTGITMFQTYRLLPVLTHSQPSEVIQVGTCAGLRNQPIGEVIHAKTFFNADLDLTAFGRKKGRLFRDENHPIIHPILVSGSTFLNSPLLVKEVVDTFDAEAFDMESFAFDTMCTQHGIPFSSIRGVSDNGQPEAQQHFLENLKKAATEAALYTLTYLQSIR